MNATNILQHIRQLITTKNAPNVCSAKTERVGSSIGLLRMWSLGWQLGHGGENCWESRIPLEI